MWQTIVPIAISAVSSLIQNNQRKQYQETLAKQQMTMPSGISEAEAIYKQLANVGLPGAEKIKENIFAAAAGNLSEARRTTGNMTDYLELLNRAYTGAEDRAEKVDVQDATAKANNSAMLANFLAGVKAPVEQGIENFDIQKNLDIQREKMIGTNNIFQTLESGIGMGIENYGKALYQEYQNDYLDALKQSWGVNETPAPVVTTPSTGGSSSGMSITPGNRTPNTMTPNIFGATNDKLSATYEVLKTMNIL